MYISDDGVNESLKHVRAMHALTVEKQSLAC